jgi:hypothetical protein
MLIARDLLRTKLTHQELHSISQLMPRFLVVGMYYTPVTAKTENGQQIAE